VFLRRRRGGRTGRRGGDLIDRAALTDVPAWRDAPPPAVQVFADANARVWRQAAEKAPRHRLRRLKSDISGLWADYRETGWRLALAMMPTEIKQ
jgi:hypothetical protein